jgi:hypothetical protein
MRGHKNSYKKYLKKAKSNSLSVMKSIKKNPGRTLGVLTVGTGVISGLIYLYKAKAHNKHRTFRIFEVK